MQNEQKVTEKSNAVEHMPAFDKIKPCEFTHGSCSNLHTSDSTTLGQRVFNKKEQINLRIAIE